MTLPGDASGAPDLRPGDSDEWVTELQRLLHLLDHLRRDPDGAFDEETRHALEEFQSAAGLPADGMVGRDTWAALVAAVPAEHDVIEPTFGDPPSTGQPSEDGQWIWDGDRWVSAGDGRPEPAAQDGHVDGVGQLSADQQWRWDGVEWQPAST